MASSGKGRGNASAHHVQKRTTGLKRTFVEEVAVGPIVKVFRSKAFDDNEKPVASFMTGCPVIKTADADDTMVKDMERGRQSLIAKGFLDASSPHKEVGTFEEHSNPLWGEHGHVLADTLLAESPGQECHNTGGSSSKLATPLKMPQPKTYRDPGNIVDNLCAYRMRFGSGVPFDRLKFSRFQRGLL